MQEETKIDSATKHSIDPSADTFKKKTYRNYPLKGITFHKARNSDIGFFVGEASNEFNPHDRYAIIIKNKDGRPFGYLPKGNFRMANYINSLPNRRVVCWTVRESLIKN